MYRAKTVAKNLGNDDHISPWSIKKNWDSCWITDESVEKFPVVLAFKKEYMARDEFLVNISAMQKYELYLDGELIGRGVERGCKEIWYYESYKLPKGRHLIVAKVWNLGSEISGWANVSFPMCALILEDLGEEKCGISTGVGAWESTICDGYSFTSFNNIGVGTDPGVVIDGEKYNFDVENGYGENWRKAKILRQGYTYSPYYVLADMPRLEPSTLPQMLEDYVDIKFDEIIVNKNAKYEQIICLDNYYCVYTKIVVSGGKGSKITVSFTESLTDNNGRKGDRMEIDGKNFVGTFDVFYPNGECDKTFKSLRWHAGLFLKISVETCDENLIIHNLSLRQTRYPYIMQSDINTDISVIKNIVPTAIRTLEMCMHDTFMDCPFYEQLMYGGDMVIEALVGYVTTKDVRLVEKSLNLYMQSKYLCRGALASAYPSICSRVIPSFGLWWILAIYDFGRWTGRMDFVKEKIPTAQNILDTYLLKTAENGLVFTPNGWNFYDWITNWKYGEPENENGICYVFNAHIAYTLVKMSELYGYFGETELQNRCCRIAENIFNTLVDVVDISTQSQHFLCLMLLTDFFTNKTEEKYLDALLNSKGEISIYFRHFKFEVYKKYGLQNRILEDMQKWCDVKNTGAKTFPEEFGDDTRSDCHGWSSHPIYHYFTGILGVNPIGFSGDKFEIKPLLLDENNYNGTVYTPKVTIKLVVNNGIVKKYSIE